MLAKENPTEKTKQAKLCMGVECDNQNVAFYSPWEAARRTRLETIISNGAAGRTELETLVGQRREYGLNKTRSLTRGVA